MHEKNIFGLGDTNAGNSTIVTACQTTFGDYIGTFNAENLSHRDTSQDEAQQMRWSLLLRYKRIIFSNELKNSIELNGNAIKKHSSGGDSLTGRVHCGLETNYIPHYLVFCFANDLPRINPYDSAVNDRINVISYSKRFVDEPTNEFKLKKDENINTEITTDKFKIIFSIFNFVILFRIYK